VTGVVGGVNGDPGGGRVLVVAPSASGAGPDGDGSGVRGDASGVESGGDRPGAGTGADGGSDPEAVAAGIADRLPVEVVLRDERTAAEYLAELGPTIDCVVILGSDTGPIGRLADDVSIPAVVCERPVVGGDDDPEPTTIPVAAVTERVRAVVREARRRSDLQDQNARLTALSRYTHDITGCETVDAVLDRTLEAATDALAFDYCVVMLVDGDRLVPRASTLPDPQLSSCGVTEGIAGRTLETGDAEIVADMQSDPDAVVEHEDLHAVLSVPIGSRGVLQVASRSCDAFDDRDREFAEILSGVTREALARLEREVTLRAERDRLHGFYMTLPVPVLCVERDGGEATVAEVNGAYEGAFGETPTGESVSAAVPTGTERDRYERVLDDGVVSRGPVGRRVDGDETDVGLTVIPVSPPGGAEYAFGVYRTGAVDAGEDG